MPAMPQAHLDGSGAVLPDKCVLCLSDGAHHSQRAKLVGWLQTVITVMKCLHRARGSDHDGLSDFAAKIGLCASF